MALGRLVCGPSDRACVANTTLDHIQESIDRFANKAMGYLDSDFTEEAQNFGAFCTRVVLENSCAALVGRFDPFRLSYLAEFQGHAKFEYGRPAKSGFRWTGDVMADDKTPQEMWGADHDVSKVSRALFSPYAEQVYWRPALERALDAVPNDSRDVFSDLTGIEPEKYTGFTRGQCSVLYSTLSKGVHWDFFVASIVMDEGTLKASIRDTLVALGGLGLVSHFTNVAYRSFDAEAAIEAYREFRAGFQ